MNRKDESLKSEIWDSLGTEQIVFLATTERDQPRVRPVTLINFQSRLFVATGSGNAKVVQMKRNPKVEFCLLLEAGNEQGMLRTECLAGLIRDRKLKEHVYDQASFSEKYWTCPDDPSYTVIELKPVVFEYMRPGIAEAVKMTA